MNEEISRQAIGENKTSANVVRGRTDKKGKGEQRKRSKSKDKQVENTCYQCGRKRHKKPACRYYKKEQERKKIASNEKKKKEEKAVTGDSSDAKGKARVAHVTSSVMIEDLSDTDDIMTIIMSPLDAYVGSMQDM